MATITLNYDARNVALKKLVEVFIALGAVKIEKKVESTKKCGLDEALDDIKCGRVTKCSNYKDFLKKINS